MPQQEIRREIIYIYHAGIATPPDGAATLIARTDDNERNRSRLGEVISCYDTDEEAGVLEDGRINIPYIPVENDSYNIINQLNNIQKVRLFVLTSEAVQNYSLIEEYISANLLLTGTVAEVTEQLKEDARLTAEAKENFYAFKEEKMKEIESLQNELDGFYKNKVTSFEETKK